MNRSIKSIFLLATTFMISCNDSTMIKPDKSGYLQIDNSRLYYEVFGKGEPLVLIHAGVTDSRMWNFQINDLSKKFKVIRFDQRGFGKSSIPDISYDPILDLLILLDSCKVNKVHLVGISLGALQAIDFAIKYPERIKTLIISGASFPDWPLPEDVLEKHIEFTRYVYENGPDSAINRMLTDPFWSKSIPDRKYMEGRQLYMQILKENKQSFTVDWQLRKLSMGLKEKLKDINCPVLMFRPGNEMPSIIPINDTIKDKVPEIEIAEISDVSHLLNMEKPKDFNRRIIEFIDEKRE